MKSKHRLLGIDTLAAPSTPAQMRLGMRDFVLLAIALFLTAAVLIFGDYLKRFDQGVYDKLLQTQTRPARDDILIIAIDDYSLNEIGKWPWNRAIHAQLLERLQPAHPKAIGFDIVFTEAQSNSDSLSSDPAQGDSAFAEALK
ncbi:MAG: CHASE2 domain-containing protein, partial [Burkholderiaceae bacterium]